MKKLLILALTGWIVLASCSASSHAVSDKKAARKERKEEYAVKNGSSKKDYKQTMKENYRQRKRMEREARKENKRSWGQNKNGDVFGVY